MDDDTYDDLFSNDNNTHYDGSSNDHSVLEEPPLDPSSSISDSDIEIHHRSEENETSEENTIQPNSDESSQEESVDDESVTMELEETTGVDGEEDIEPGEPTGVG